MEPKPIRLLLIEDDPDFADTLKIRLNASKGFSFSIDCANDLDGGLKRISKGAIDVVLLDLNLKDSEGLATLKKVNQQAKDLPIIVLTGKFDESIGPETLRLGAQDYFLKGEIHPEALLRSIRYSIERKHYEASLEKAYHEIKSLLASIPSIVIWIDPNGKVRSWNESAERILGVPHKQAIDRPLSECHIQWDYSILKKGFTNCRVQKRPLRLEDIPFKRSDGINGFLGVTVSPVEEVPGEPVGILIYGADITERRRLEAELPNKSRS